MSYHVVLLHNVSHGFLSYCTRLCCMKNYDYKRNYFQSCYTFILFQILTSVVKAVHFISLQIKLIHLLETFCHLKSSLLFHSCLICNCLGKCKQKLVLFACCKWLYQDPPGVKRISSLVKCGSNPFVKAVFIQFDWTVLEEEAFGFMILEQNSILSFCAWI